MTLQEIANNLPDNMPKIHRNRYLKNIQDIQSNEINGYNPEWTEAMRNENFNLILFYLRESGHYKDEIK